MKTLLYIRNHYNGIINAFNKRIHHNILLMTQLITRKLPKKTKI